MNSNLKKAGIETRIKQNSVHVCSNTTSFLYNYNHKSVKYDHLGECTPEKDCLWWYWLTLTSSEPAGLTLMMDSLRLSKHQSMSPQTFLLRTTLIRTIILHQLMIWLMGPNLLQNYTDLNFNFHLRPTFTQKALRTVACIAGEVGKGEGERAREKNGGLAPRQPFFYRACSPSPFPTSPATQAMHTAVAVNYEFHVTRNCFWAGFLWKSISFRVILLKIVHKHAGMYSSIIKLLFPGIILWLCWPNIFFSLLHCPICCCQRYLAVEDAVWLSRRKILSVFVSEELVLWSKKNQKKTEI